MIKTSLFTLCSCLNLVFASQLKIYEDQQYTELQRTSDQKEMAILLNGIGVRFEQWEASQPLSPTATEEEIKQAYQTDIEKVQREGGFQFVDVLRMVPDHPKKVELRNKYLNEHSHTEDEVRFFVEGSATFFLHVEGKVYAVTCEKGDLMSIPPFYRHFFDMGSDPCFTAIRFFTRTDGWIAHFTGDPISQHFVKVNEAESH